MGQAFGTSLVAFLWMVWNCISSPTIGRVVIRRHNHYNGLHIGAGMAMEPGSFWSGLIDDVRIYNRAVNP